VDKSPEAFRTISEVASDLDLPQHVLRFWETRFSQIRPLKRAGGRRYYRPDDVELLRGIQHLLYGEGYTIRGVQKILREAGIKHVVAVGRGGPEAAAALAAVPHPGPDEDEATFELDGAGEERPTASAAVRAARAAAAAEPLEAEGTMLRPGRRAPDPHDVDPGQSIPRDIRVDDDEPHRSSPFRFLERLKGEHPRAGEGGQLSREDVRHLQATLFELIECKRLLDQAR
jgi:DNA-binding transcriptional MerR regulator